MIANGGLGKNTMTAILERLNVGIVGACNRGASFQAGFAACPEARVHAVCDLDAGRLSEAARTFEASEQYTDYQQMLSRSDLDAVVIATPMPLHATQAIMALQEGLHVLSEVTAAVSVEEAEKLVVAAHAARGIYMLAENCNYFITNMIVTELVRRGLFGTTYFADGEYLHNVKDLAERTPWRRVLLGVDGITYGTHSLGPMLQWLPGDRVASVCCAGSGHNCQDPRGDDYHQDTSIMLGKMASGGLIKLRVDMVSQRPHLNCTYQLQGTNGCYESARTPTGQHRVWLSERSDSPEAWIDLSDLEEEFLPDRWRQAMERAAGAGHGGSDFFVIQDFIEAVAAGGPSPIGVHEAMDMTLPGLISQQSIAAQGQWLEVPDSRDWVTGVGA